MLVGAHLDRAEALLGEKRLSEAIPILEKVVSKRPREARALHMLGVALAMSGPSQEAEELLRKAAALKQSARILMDLAILLIMTNRSVEALPLLQNACKREPDLRLAQFYTGVALTNLERHEEAFAIFNRLSQIDPTNDLYEQNCAALLAKLGRFDEAEASADRALARNSRLSTALSVKSIAAINRENFEEARVLCDRILAREPDHIEARYNRGHIRLITGELNEGWPDYEARLERHGHSIKPPCPDVPLWSGQSLKGKSLLVYAEQGLGDIFLICRYLPLLIDQSREVSFLIPRAMIQTLRRVSEQIHYIDTVADGQSFDFQLPMMSLPRLFATSITSIPNAVPYLSAEPEKVKFWRDAIGNHGFKIGIAWQGTPTVLADLGRSIPVAEFQPLSKIPDVRLISLQKNFGLDQLAHLPAGMQVEQLNSSGTDGFIDTSAVMTNMDMIVTSDTSIANLAGALGLRAWVVLKRVPDWRWMAAGEHTPWFPTLRLARRGPAQSWQEVLQFVAQRVEAGLRP